MKDQSLPESNYGYVHSSSKSMSAERQTSALFKAMCCNKELLVQALMNDILIALVC